MESSNPHNKHGRSEETHPTHFNVFFSATTFITLYYSFTTVVKKDDDDDAPTTRLDVRREAKHRAKKQLFPIATMRQSACAQGERANRIRHR